MLKKIIKGNTEKLLKCEMLCIVEKNGKSWRVNFWKKNTNEMEVSSNFRKKASRVQDRPTKLKKALKNWKTKKVEKNCVQTLVKLLISEKSWNFKKNFAGEKIINFWKVLQKCKKRKIEKRANKIENKHRKVEEKPENNCRKFRQKLERTKKVQIWKNR